MKQPHLPFKRKRAHTFLKVFLIITGIALAVALTAYSLITYTKDDLVKYFPQDTNFFIALKLDRETRDSTFFKRLDFSQEVKNQLLLLIEDDIELEVDRNIGIGVLNNTQVVGIVYLRHALSDTHPIFTLLRDEGINSFKITSKIAKREFLVMSNSETALNDIKEVVENNKRGLEQNLSLTLGRHFISGNQGIVYVSEPMSEKILSTLGGGYISTENIKGKSATLGFELEQDTIKLQTSRYEQEEEVWLPNPSELLFAVHVDKPVDRFSTYLDNPDIGMNIEGYNKENSLNIANLVSDTDVAYGYYARFDETKDLLHLSTTTPEKVKSSISEWLKETLANKRQKTYTRTLPDGTTIKSIEKNRDDIVVKDSKILDLFANDSYFFNTTPDNVTVYKNIDEQDLRYAKIQGCDIQKDSDYVYLSNEFFYQLPVVGEIGEFVLFSLYPQSYPQFLVCIK